jgi:glycerol-3-phosphate acyltransferase PlsY
LVVFVAAVGLTRYVSLGSMLAAVSFPAALWWLAPAELDREARTALLVSSSLIALLVLARHRANLQRLLAGTENKLGGTKTA